MRKPDAILIATVAIAALIAMRLDHAFFANPAGYGELKAPTYAAHGLLFAAYIAFIGLRAPVEKWKTIALALAGASFGLWSRPVVVFALSMNERPGAIGDTFRAIDAWNGSPGSGALITGISLSGALMAATLLAYTRSIRTAAWVLLATALAALLAVSGWSRVLGATLSIALIDASGVLWHTSVAAALARWRSHTPVTSEPTPTRPVG